MSAQPHECLRCQARFSTFAALEAHFPACNIAEQEAAAILKWIERTEPYIGYTQHIETWWVSQMKDDAPSYKASTLRAAVLAAMKAEKAKR